MDGSRYRILALAGFAVAALWLVGDRHWLWLIPALTSFSLEFFLPKAFLSTPLVGAVWVFWPIEGAFVALASVAGRFLGSGSRLGGVIPVWAVAFASGSMGNIVGVPAQGVLWGVAIAWVALGSGLNFSSWDRLSEGTAKIRFGLALFGLWGTVGLIERGLLWLLPLPVIPMAAFWSVSSMRSKLETVFDESIAALALLLQRAHPGTHEHLLRVAKGAEATAAFLGLDPVEAKRLRQVGILHDIGKIAVDAEILDKAGPLSDAEMEVVRRHPDVGAEILSSCSEFRDLAPDVRHHHERIDGRGYPSRLVGENIPIGSRIIAVVDAFDAMTGGEPANPRPYRDPVPVEDALAELDRCSGSQFDPAVVRAFKEVHSLGMVG